MYILNTLCLKIASPIHIISRRDYFTKNEWTRFHNAKSNYVGFMYEQYLNVKKIVRWTFLIWNLQRKVILHIVLRRKVKQIYMFFNGSGGHLGFLHEQDRKK